MFSFQFRRKLYFWPTPVKYYRRFSGTFRVEFRDIKIYIGRVNMTLSRSYIDWLPESTAWRVFASASTNAHPHPPTLISHTHPNRTSHYNVCLLITANAAQDWAMVINDNWGHVCRFADTIWRTINRSPNFLYNIMSTTWRPIVFVATYTHVQRIT